MDAFGKDLKLSLRLLARTPGFTLAAVAVLALGIGLNAGMFGVVRALVFSPRPFAEPDRLAQLYSTGRKNPSESRGFSYPVYREIAGRGELFQGVLAYGFTVVGVADGPLTRRSFSAIVSSNYFGVLGVPPARGRGFTSDEARPGSDVPVVVASHPFWRTTGFDPALLGRTIKVNERAFTVVGIAPAGFAGTMTLVGPELYFPLGVYDSLTNDFQNEARKSLDRPDAQTLFLVARLREGVSRESADAALSALAAGIERAHPVEQKDQTFSLGEIPRIGASTSPSQGGPLAVLGTLLLGLTGAVLLVVCLNLAGLLLARGHARRREFAIRLALGGGRARIVRQLLTEGLVLALLGGACGVLLASWATTLLVRSLVAIVPVTVFFEASASPALLAATALFCVLATAFFALGPALRLSRADVIDDLKRQAGEDAERRPRFLPRHPLVASQVALSLALLIGSGLFVRMVGRALQVDMGYEADDTVVVEVDGSLAGYDEARSRDLYRRLEERLSGLPGVGHASIAATVPFGMLDISKPVRRAGLAPAPDSRPSSPEEGRAFHATWNAVGADYFAAMGQALRAGRPFTPSEAASPGAPPVAIVDLALARKLWPAGDALGQRIEWSGRDAAGAGVGLEIVGIVAAVRTDGLEKEPRGAVYVPFAQGFLSNAHFHLRPRNAGEAAALALLEPVRRELQAAAPGLPVFELRSFRRHAEGSAGFWALRTSAAMFSAFGGMAMLVAVVGLYGTKAYAVSRRTREIGVRMALGARPRAILAMILGEGLRTTLLGVAIGVVLGAALGRVLGGVIVDFDASDPLAFGAAPAALLLAATVACWIPARRATRIAPMSALRTE